VVTTPRTRRWPAAVPVSSGASLAGRLSWLGGTLELAQDGVRFTPLRRLGRIRHIPLGNVAGVTEAGDRPARLRITDTSGRSLTLIVPPRRHTPVWSSDTSARDESITAIMANSIET
jgi:hypothetical protein